MFHPYIYTLILLASLLFTSCASLSNNELISKQTVLVDSIPQNADIFYNGELVGSTPMELSLPTGIAHKVTLNKEGFKNQTGYFNPSSHNQEKPFLKLGLVQDLGYYYALAPERLVLELEWDLLPSTPGITPFISMGDLTNKADKMFESGVISEENYRIIINQIIDFFGSY